MQPFPLMEDIRSKSSFFFEKGKKLRVSVYEDGREAGDSGPGLLEGVERGKEVAKGTLVLGERLWVDSEGLNVDLFKRKEKYVKWKEEFDKIAEACK